MSITVETKWKLFAVVCACVTVLLLAGLFARANRYQYYNRGTWRYDRFTQSVCVLGQLPNPKWQTVPQKVMDDAWAKTDNASVGRYNESLKPGQKTPAKSVLDPWIEPKLGMWGESNPTEEGYEDFLKAEANLKLESESDAAAKWNAAHNAGLIETYLGWECR